MLLLQDLFDLKIERPDDDIYRQAKGVWDHISKPIDGLGDFEALVCRLSSIKGTLHPEVSKRALIVMCADNGVVSEGISQSDKSVTGAVATALGRGISSACTLGRSSHTDVIPVDIGIDTEEAIEGVMNLKVARGTNNFLNEAAMSKEQALLAIERGVKIVDKLSVDGYDILATGEMGIGNTTTSAAVLSAILHADSDKIAGRGAGLDNPGFDRKRSVIRRALGKYDFGQFGNEKERVFEILRTLGGLDIAALVGVFIGGAISHVPIVIDGFISATAALVAQRLVPGTVSYMIPSHRGRETGTMLALDELGLCPYIDGNMALGEGTGALMLFPLMDMVIDYYEKGAKFSDYDIEEYKRFT